ncbi:hypothetical protein CYQ88_08390 [Hydrogenovibrio sp. SC-1]|uniref:ParB N-terminal domain-containing protein n=1 Tax=Hydrogenovibrio sp. SC-1 TaxID=2065820 RepID=UPI000C79F3C6|nr:ParB N-terminal domain-containing protein [Hydrogenovibrio sp. SC-1]PLA73973.1 hypothetical protein CYQ88_08390 [Hydrogenovibrio sp. SC-1]
MANDRKTISVKHILFDDINPRHDPSEGQKEALQKLIKDEDIRQLAADIVNHGINPTESLIIMPSPNDDKKYIVLEGNRRLAALKALQKPTLCAIKSDETYFSKLSKKYKGDYNITCTLFNSREEAHHWILIKHGNNQGGATTKRWDPTQNARYAENTNTKSPNDRAYKLLKYALDNELISKENHDNIKITTITRYISNPSFRKSIGVDFRKNWIQSNLPRDIFNEVVQRFLLDGLIDSKNGGLSSRIDATGRENYGHKLLSDFNLHEHRQKHYGDLPKSTNNESEPDSNEKIKPKSKRDNNSPNKRNRVIPNDFKLQINKPKIKRIYDELKKLDLKTYPNAAALLFRGFIELSIHHYLEKVMGQHQQQRDLHKHINKVVENLISKGIPEKRLNPLKAAANTPTPSSPLSANLMNNYVHGTVEPSPTDLILAWDPIQDSIGILFDEINKMNSGQKS